MTECINHRIASNLEELQDAIDVLRDDSQQPPSTVYVMCKGSPAQLELIEETLDDGSKVYNIHIREAR